MAEPKSRSSSDAQQLPFAGAPMPHLRILESVLVRDVLQSLQGYPSSSLLWDGAAVRFRLRKGVHFSHLSHTGIARLLRRFVLASTSLRRTEAFASRAACPQASPTLQAFAHSVSLRIQHLRNAAMEMEIDAEQKGGGKVVTLLSLAANLSWVCAGAEFLEQVVNEVVPHEGVMHQLAWKPAELGSHILSYLYDKLNEFCLINDGEEEPYRTLLLLFIGSLRPLTESLDRWLHEGVLSDPFGEMFFYANKSIEIEDADFWKHGFHLRSIDHVKTLESELVQSIEGALSPANGSGSHIRTSFPVPEKVKQINGKVHKSTNCSIDSPSLNPSNLRTTEEKIACPSFLYCIAKAIISAGKSLQLLQYGCRRPVRNIDANNLSNLLAPSMSMPLSFPAIRYLSNMQSRCKSLAYEKLATPTVLVKNSSNEHFKNKDVQELEKHKVVESVSLYEKLCQSLEQLLAQKFISCSMFELKDGIHQLMKVGFSFHSNTSQYSKEHKDSHVFYAWKLEEYEQMNLGKVQQGHKSSGILDEDTQVEKINKTPWFSSGLPTLGEDYILHPSVELQNSQLTSTKNQEETMLDSLKAILYPSLGTDKLRGKMWATRLNLSNSSTLPALNDRSIWEAVFFQSDCCSTDTQSQDLLPCDSKIVCDNSASGEKERSVLSECDYQSFDSIYSGELEGTDYGNGLGCGNLCVWHAEHDLKLMEHLFPYPTTLPFFQEALPFSELSQAGIHQRVASLVLHWLQKVEFKAIPLPAILVQECLISFIQMQVEAIGTEVLDRLMGGWGLMEELAVLRAIYLIGSGDLLQQFCSVLFGKLDRGEPWDDFYELNTMLQESVRSSADAMLLPGLDSLAVMIRSRTSSAAENGNCSVPSHFLARGLAFGIDALDSLYFIYKVAWPLELIINDTAIKKYNQVMNFLLKVKRAKFALDKACRWMWKDGGGDAANMKQQLLLQQKLMHFVNTLHQYVMDQVLYSAWVELCECVSSACSLDEVIAFHDAYLVAIQRQCLVAPDKLWALIASRVRTILGLALDFYSVQRTLRGGGAASAIKARSLWEIDRIGRQFDECIAFLLRVLSFKLNVGHFPHLAELVTRLNFNYYYMSESGHLLTLPDVSSGRGSQERARSHKN